MNESSSSLISSLINQQNHQSASFASLPYRNIIAIRVGLVDRHLSALKVRTLLTEEHPTVCHSEEKGDVGRGGKEEVCRGRWREI